MCVICVSEKGVQQPDRNTMLKMWNTNPHGAGYMFARSKYVNIRKGFMDFDSFYNAVKKENFTKDDVVVYHFRIATQGGITREMTHPFMLDSDLSKMNVLRARTNLGIAHNGIIQMTSKMNVPGYSDTALFITKYLSKFVDRPSDFADPRLVNKIKKMIGSKMAVLDYKGNVTRIGNFTQDKTGLWFSNTFFMNRFLWGVA